ncbi:hypothetical protein BpHYR1_024067 [Brachionus plicatilis]|uniref:Uncharacterized protein n=1 Tax=Brachionus plicatilis TaxID=10195 RepID=A0A3M7S0J7_BRAPC|nr:hypothetical protein BpHYR1_024067 [Brachionus plicatilis]
MVSMVLVPYGINPNFDIVPISVNLLNSSKLTGNSFLKSALLEFFGRPDPHLCSIGICLATNGIT